MSLEKEESEGNAGFTITAIIVSLAIIGLWFLTYFILKDDKERGTLGDMFGSINALFSGLALAGIILTILLQRKELKYQRDELKETRKEFEIQNETLKLQRFENTFFSILNLHHQIVSGIDFRYYKRPETDHLFVTTRNAKEAITITGRDVFRFTYNTMAESIKEHPKNFVKIYYNAYAQSQTDYGHYFRNLYRMIKLVDETDFFYSSNSTPPNEVFKIKYRYTSIIRSQLSDFELLWLFYNCLTSNGDEKFKPLIEKYSLFKNLPKLLLPVEEHIELYDKRAYKQT